MSITDHHDGHALNGSLAVHQDEPSVGGASHNYVVVSEDAGQVAEIQFQQGPWGQPDSTPGCTEAVLVAIVLDRLRAFQAGPYPCRENAIAITKLEEALHRMRDRADDRALRGVLGELKK